MNAQRTAGRRVRTVEHDAGFGWIARSSRTDEEVLPGFRWTSRAIARTVVLEDKLFAAPATPAPQDTKGADHE